MRIGIVNDIKVAAEGLRKVVTGIPDHSVAWIAQDGAEAVEKCRQDTPDLILMDLIMPVMDGVEATRRIMASTPCPILVVTATIDGNSSKVFGALGAGALDVVQMPLLGGKGQADGASAIKFKIATLRRRTSGDQRLTSVSKPTRIDPLPVADGKERLVAIGASAGGPAAVATILSNLRSDFPASVIVVQHIDARFAPAMVSWLNEQSKVPVRIAVQGERPQKGTVLIAGTNDHLAFINAASLGYTEEPRDCNYRPSVDVFFESVVRHWPGEVVGVLLSGMGKDGAQGLKSLRDAGAFTIAQDSATSAVYGMPKAAAELKAATKILPIHEIAGELMSFFSDRRSITLGR
jgi:two-component system response regulator WspF